MLRRVLIANRGEIALRIVRACRDLGIRSVAAYSEADARQPFVELADQAVLLGPAPALQSYLSIDALLSAAKKTSADAIHPGYGFLSEHAGLARAAREAGLTFVGPSPEVIEALGSKLETRARMQAAGVPVLPGTPSVSSVDDLRAAVAALGYPVLVKPSGGGGGRGMRAVMNEPELEAALETGGREAARAFGDSEVYVEKLIHRARHVEVQILGDARGRVIHVGDRDCSLQRRHQKVIEEAPAYGLSEAQHAHVCELAVRAAQAVGYTNAGTVELLYDGQNAFYVLEVNTRIQVEHGVTEAVTGIDLVATQLAIAGGEPLGFDQDAVTPRGVAIEARVYAEDPSRKFLPSPGRISAARFAAGPWVRGDRGVEPGSEVPPYYDGLLGKLIVWGHDRKTALARLRRALYEERIEGIKTNLALLRWLADSEAFAAGNIDIGFIERELSPVLLEPYALGKITPA